MNSKSWMRTGVRLVLGVAILATVRPGAAEQPKFSGFLKDYSEMKPHPELEGAYQYLNTAPNRTLRDYSYFLIDPVVVQIHPDSKDVAMPPEELKTLADYFRYAIVREVADAFPIVDTPGALVLRLRAAITHVMPGEPVKVPGKATALSRSLHLGEVSIEVEVVDSVTGERIGALVDTKQFGKEAAPVGAFDFSQHPEYAGATAAFDSWAKRFRKKLDMAHAVDPATAERIKREVPTTWPEKK